MSLTLEQLKNRHNYIGGSDAAAILGLSRWKTPLQVWAEKTGAIPFDPKESIPMKVGKALENTVRALFEERTGKQVYGQETEFFHPKFPFLGCHVDGLIHDENAIYEGKTATAYKEKEWADEEIPAEYILQAMHSLAVTGRDRCYLGILIGNHNFKDKVVDRDPVLISEIVKKEVTFWNTFVVPKLMPNIITKNDAPTLYQLFPHPDLGSKIQLGDDEARIIEARNAIVQDQKSLEAQRDKLENELKAKMGKNEYAEAGVWLISWKEQTRKAHAVKESTFRKLDIKEAK